jgi:peptidoglycan hydrolase-like protein with peptidoglycan-binding domain
MTAPAKTNSGARGARHSPSKKKWTYYDRTSPSREARRRSAMRPDPQRVQEIQRALFDAGELHEAPTSRWDEATREAMKRYQQANGFAITGLPDSKSLMKMGLGPHPLPAEVATPPNTRASLDSTAPSTPQSAPHTETSRPADPSQEHR